MLSSFFSAIVVYLVHFEFIYKNGVDIPFWDQWDSEADLYIMYESGTLKLKHLFEFHNEHRIALTRLFNLAIYVLYGGWSPKIVMYFQAIIPSILCFFIVRRNYMIQSRDKVLFILSSISLVVVLATPTYYDNILWGFQNQFYFLIFLGYLNFELYYNKLNNTRIILIFLIQILSVFTMASGFLSVFVSSILAGFLFMFHKNKNYLILMFTGLLISIISYISIPVIGGHANLKASSLESFLISLRNIIEWSWFVPGLIYLIYGLVFVYFFNKYILNFKNSMHKKFNMELVSFFFFIWSISLFASISYGRGGAPHQVYTSRYFTLYIMSLISVIIMIRTMQISVIFKTIIFLSIGYNILFWNKCTPEYSEKFLFYLGNLKEKKEKFEKIYNNGNFNSVSEFNNINLHPNPGKPIDVTQNKYLIDKHLWLTKKNNFGK